MGKLNFGREKARKTISTLNVYPIPTITPEEAEKIHERAIKGRELRAQLKETAKENKKILKALQCQYILDTLGHSETLLDGIWAEKEYRDEHYALLVEFGDKNLITWYQLYRGYMEEFNKGKPFNPAENYWLTFQEIHDHSVAMKVPTRNVRFRRNFSNYVYDRIPKQFQDLFIDMFNFFGRYGKSDY